MIGTDQATFGPLGSAVYPTNNKSKLNSVDDMELESRQLNNLSSFKSKFDFEIYRQLEERFSNREIRGGTTFKTTLKLANFHSSCSKCFYALELDTYGRGCIHECAYCYAKDELSLHGAWNKPIPFPININSLRKIFFQVFETDRKTKWRAILSKRIPIRLGSMSDSFMWMDRKYKVTQEVLKILNHYNYPYVIFTRSDLVAQPEYLKLLNPKNCSVQFSLCGIDERLTKIMEPGSPSVARRLKALRILGDSGIWTAARINPVFPTYPDGYFSNPSELSKRFPNIAEIPKLEFFDIGKIDVFLEMLSVAKVKTVLAGFVRLKSSTINRIGRDCGIDLRPFFLPTVMNTGLSGNREKKYSDSEIKEYYDRIEAASIHHGLRFSTCYIGNGIKDFYQYQDLWSNKVDCCDIKGNVSGFKTTSQEIPWKVREQFTGDKTGSRIAEMNDIVFDSMFQAKNFSPENQHSRKGITSE